jgi:hypothetical protein
MYPFPERHLRNQVSVRHRVSLVCCSRSGFAGADHHNVRAEPTPRFIHSSSINDPLPLSSLVIQNSKWHQAAKTSQSNLMVLIPQMPQLNKCVVLLTTPIRLGAPHRHRPRALEPKNRRRPRRRRAQITESRGRPRRECPCAGRGGELGATHRGATVRPTSRIVPGTVRRECGR